MNTPYFENNIAKVFYDTKLNTVFLEYKAKAPTQNDFVEINTKAMECFRSFKTQKFVADIRKMGILSLEAQQFVVDKVLPALISHLAGKPLIHAQLLDEKEIMAKVSANNVKQKSAKAIENFQLHQFYTTADLEKFLTQN